MSNTTVKRATLQDVSQEAGVSIATVSRVLNDSAGVEQIKAQRVRDAVRSLGYQPLRKATRTRAKEGAERPSRDRGRRAGRVAVLLFSDDLLAPYSNDLSSTIRGVARALAAKGMTMVYADLSADADPPQEVIAGEVDGLLLAGNVDRASRLRDLPARPTVWLTSHHEARGEPSALAGNEHVGQIAADYLIDVGCTRLACLDTSRGSPAIEVRSSYFGYTAAQAGLACARVQGADRLPSSANPDAWDDYAAMARALTEEALAATATPDGLFVTDPFALGIVHATLRRHGLEPEHDVKIVVSGYHPPILSALDPRPAAIDLRGEIIGRCAVQQLLWRLEHPADQLPVDLMIRPKLVRPDDVAEHVATAVGLA